MVVIFYLEKIHRICVFFHSGGSGYRIFHKWICGISHNRYIIAVILYILLQIKK